MNLKNLAMLTAFATVSLMQTIDAAPFKLNLYSATNLAVAGAGGAAISDDASTMFLNPASMTHLCGTEVTATAFGIFPSLKFHNDDTFNILGQIITGGDGGNAGENALVGASFISKEIGCGFWAGLGINAPFGLATDYGHEWVGRYHAVRSYLLTVNLNPSVAYRINDCWSIGVGFSALYAHVKFTNAVDFGLIGFGLQIPGFEPEADDGQVVLKGNSWGYGGNVGILWDLSPCTRFGASYRSQIYLDVDGSERFKDRPSVFDDAFPDTRVHSKLKLPATASISGYHQYSPCWAIMGDVTWTGWSSVETLVIKFDSDQSDSVTTLNLRDSYKFALGSTFSPNCCWIFRGGLAYETHLYSNKEEQSVRSPNNDIYIAAIGAGYRMNRCWKFDIAYTYEYMDNPKVDKSDFELEEDAFRGGLKGHWDAHVHAVALQATFNF